VGVLQIGAGKGRTFHVGVIGVAVTALAVGPRDILEVKNYVTECTILSLVFARALDTSVQVVQQFQFLLFMTLYRGSVIH
jgi:hypothetical protein